ncbi:hypothetical protein K1719_022602 [Acacia pycnantha]|nr:hypothetical protein K1719_022602 [Acacia pycnantha]
MPPRESTWKGDQMKQCDDSATKGSRKREPWFTIFTQGQAVSRGSRIFKVSRSPSFEVKALHMDYWKDYVIFCSSFITKP